MASKELLKSKSCKIGTKPGLLILCYAYKIRPGLRMKVREAHHGSKPFTVIVNRINDDGYFFCERI